MLRGRWLGRVRYRDALALQHGLFERSEDDHLLLLEHTHVFTLGARGTTDHLKCDPDAVGAELVRSDRGGDITYHGPGQLVGYPILTLDGDGAMADTVGYVRSVEQLLIDALAELGLTDTGRMDGYPGVWVAPRSDNPRKIAAIGVRLTRGRTMHGFALNVDPDLIWFDRIVPCGIDDKAVTSLGNEGIDVVMREVVDVVWRLAAARWGTHGAERADLAWRERPADLAPFTRNQGGRPEASAASGSVRLTGRLAEAGVRAGLAVDERKPPWLRVPARMDEGYRSLRHTLREHDLVTVCEEAGCPNVYECWADGTATFMVNGNRCTRACGFCLIDTRRPEPPAADEPDRVAAAVAELGLNHAVVTTVARDDLPDGGAAHVAATIDAIRDRNPATAVEVLISDCQGDPADLSLIFDARPDVLNHNIETVLRLQRAVRPSAGYARSLAVLARAKADGLVTKSGLMVGLGEEIDEVHAALADLAGVGVDVVTIGQYLRPTAGHLAVSRWWRPEEFDALAAVGRDLGIGHVEASPLTRSSYHARQAVGAVTPARAAVTA
jgi:lipoic acid synthetase